MPERNPLGQEARWGCFYFVTAVLIAINGLY